MLGTLVEIDVEGTESTDALNAAVDAAFAAIEQVHQLMSFQDPDSELSRVNSQAAVKRQRIDARTFEVIQAALQFARISGGAFNPCVHGAGCWQDIELIEDHTVQFHQPLQLDLSGIAKGFAVDQGMAALLIPGIDRIMVNAGGDLRVAGSEPWKVVLRHPQSPSHACHALTLLNTSLATSAPYFARALVNGRDGRAYEGHASVSVRAVSCMAADALTKIVFFAEPAVAARCLEWFDAKAITLTG
jgi:FAD:protein FMN transferase